LKTEGQIKTFSSSRGEATPYLLGKCNLKNSGILIRSHGCKKEVVYQFSCSEGNGLPLLNPYLLKYILRMQINQYIFQIKKAKI
jgi:hypothetical protein